MAENYKFVNYAGAEMAELFDKIADLDVATQSKAGLMSDTDKTKLDELPAGAQENVLEGVQLAGTDLTITEKKVNIPVDNAPTEGSSALIRSGAVHSALAATNEELSRLGQEVDNIVNLTGTESNISIPLTASGGIDPDAVRFSCFIKAGMDATFSLNDASGIIGNNTLTAYKVIGGVRTSWFSIKAGQTKTMAVSEDIHTIAFHISGTSVSADGNVEMKIEQQGELSKELSETGIFAGRKVERLAYIGRNSAGKTDWVIGDKIFNTIRGTLAVCTSPSPNVDFGEQYLPSLESVYIYDGKLYIYNGTTLVPVSGADGVNTDALELAVNGNFSKSYDVKAGVNIDGLSASSPYAVPLVLGEGESFTIQRNTSIVSSIAIYAIKADGSTQSIGGLYNNNVRTFSAPVDMVALGVYIPGSNISANGTYTLTVNKTPLWQTQKDVTDLSKKVGLAESANYKVSAVPSDLFDQSEFIIGDNWHGRIDTNVKYRVSMASIHTADRDLYLSILDGYRFALDLFVNGAYSSSVNYRQSPYKISQGTEYVLKIAKYPEDTSLEADLGLFVSQVRIQSEFQQTLFGKGFVGYYGQRVSPLKMQKNYQCDENVLISQTMPSDGNNVNKNAAGLVVYGNRIFSFNDGATCSVFALDTLELLQVASLPWSAHNNNAQPTPYFYDSGDSFPLLLVSRGDYAGSGEQKFYFVRVVESSGSFTFTIVKEVSYSGFPGAEYNCSWFANYERGELYCYSYPNGGWSVAENNPIIFHKFTFPSLDNYDPVTLTDADVKETITLQDHWIMQSALYHNDKIFVQVEADGSWQSITINGQPYDFSKGRHFLFVINANSGYIETLVPIHGDQEQEGMCIYDGELYMSEKYSSAQVGNVCFRLVKYDF